MTVAALKTWPWEWIWRGVLLLAIGGVIGLSDQRYDARYLKLDTYAADKRAASELAAAKSEALQGELARMRQDIGEMKGDVKTLLRQNAH